MASFRLSQIGSLLAQEAPCEGEITRCIHDSRESGPGALFFALKGQKVDGHVFLREVAERGATAAVVTHDYRGSDYGLTLFRVEHVLKAVQEMARAVQRVRKGRVVAVTGSVGKTTTKEFIATLLQSRFRVAKTPGNSNSQVTFPLSLLNAEDDAEVFVVEMGMSEKGEIARLVQIAPPQIAVVTNVSYSHALFFPEGIEGIARAKAEIFSSSETELGIVSAQAAQFAPIRETGNFPKVVYDQLGASIQLPFSASHLCEDFVGAATVARAMGLSWEEIRAQAPRLATLPNRFERVVHHGIVFINDSYNANATSMSAALANLPAPGPGKKRIGVLGSMKELGEYTHAHHHEVGLKALQSCARLLCLGEECRVMVDLFQQHQRPAELHSDLAAIKKRLFEIAEPGDVVLLKGSKPHCLWKILE